MICGGLLLALPAAGCSAGAPGSAKRTGPAAATGAPAAADAGPPDPLAAPTEAPLALVFAYSLSEELACSQSFESDGWSARYELTLEPSGAATLTLSSFRSHELGPSAARFHPETDGETTRTHRGEDRTFRGSFTWKGTGFAVALAPEEARCKSLVQGKGWYAVDCGPAAGIAATCTRKKVEALPAFGAPPPEGGDGATAAVDAFECAPAFGLPAPGEIDEPLPAAIPFAPAPGLEIEYWRHGIGNSDKPKLRLAPPDAPVTVD